MKINNLIITLIAISLFALTSCSTTPSRSNNHSYDTLYTPKYASHFIILESADSLVLQVKNPWQGAQNIEYNYSFGKNETPQRIIAMSSSHTAFFDTLALTNHIVGVSGPQYLCNKKLQNLPDVGYDNNIHYETVVSLEPDIMTTYEISGENSSSRQKLISLNIPLVYVADYLEDSPLGKAEWIIAFGVMSGKIEGAQQIFKSVSNNYNSLKAKLQKHLATASRKPKIMLNSPYRDVWYLPGDNSYMVQLISDAGGDYLAKGVDDNVSRTVSIEVAFSMVQQADIWLNPAANIVNKEDLAASNALLKGIKTPLYNNTLRGGTQGGSDFWESGVLRPDVILEDLVRIFYPEIEPDHQLYYYKEITSNE